MGDLQQLALSPTTSRDQAFEARRRLLPVLQISASQLEAFDGSPESCNRRWAFESIFKLPKVEKGAQNFGSVLHSVLERYLDSDANGYALGPDGKSTDQPQNYYPEGWEGGLGEAEQQIIRQLVIMAVEGGYLERYEGRQVEYGFLGQVTEYVKIKGFIDLLCVKQGIVTDHKSTSNFKYVKSPEKLRTATQMLVYAKVLLEMAKDQGIEHKTVTLRHNQFLKDMAEPRVKRAEAVVTVADVEKAWKWVQEKAEEMRLWRDKIWLSGAHGQDKLKEAGTEKIPGLEPIKWNEIPGPPTISACHAFGGCQFANICGKIESVDGYRTRIQKYLDKQAAAKAAAVTTNITTTTITDTKNNRTNVTEIDMGVISRATSATKTTTVVATAPAAPNPAATPNPTPAPAPSNKVVVSAPAAKIIVKKPAVVTTVGSGAVKDEKPPTISGFQELTPENPLAVNGATVPIAESTVITPPWADPNCKACGSAGINDKGYCCPICDSTAATSGRPSSDDYKVTFNKATGTVTWEPKATATPDLVDMSEIEPIVSSEDVALVQSGDDGVDNGEESQAKPELNADGTPKKRRGRPPGSRNKNSTKEVAVAAPVANQPTTQATPPVKATAPASVVATTSTTTEGFILCIDCSPVGNYQILNGMALFNQLTAQVAADEKAADYYDLNAFGRRDKLAQKIRTAALSLTGAIAVSSGSVDVREFAEQLSGYAIFTVRPNPRS